MTDLASDLRLVRPSDVESFEDLAGSFLAGHEAENCVILGLCAQLRGGTASIQSSEPYFAVVMRDHAVAGAALIAGYLVLLSYPIEDQALPLLVADIAEATPQVPGAVATVSASARFPELWTARTGRPHRLHMSERIFQLDRVMSPGAVEGAMRIVDEGDRDTLTKWLSEFQREALGQPADQAAMERFAQRWTARDGRTMYLWVVHGSPVSMVGVSGETPNGIRVAPVYTPPVLRGRGFASALTAAVSQRQLETGRRFCFLFTDLANPTSNHIYQAIGYRPVADVADYRFDPPARS